MEVVVTDDSLSIAKFVGDSFQIEPGDMAKLSLSAREAQQLDQREKNGRKI